MNRISLRVNGKVMSAVVEPRTHLADLLRDFHNLTGTHVGCEHGVCGACTVLLDDVPARSCITLAVACENAEVTTVEGLDDDGVAIELRSAFTDEHALQCGYCTPGIMVAARDLVLRLETPSEQDIRIAMSGNLCRCTGYVGIVRAIQRVIESRRGRGIAAVPGGARTVLGPAGSGHAVASIDDDVHSKRQPNTTPARESEGLARFKSTSRADFDWNPQSSFTQSFSVGRPVDAVWELFGRIGDVASCLPGASLAGDPVAGHVEGQIRVKVGPISAEFRGIADVTRDETTRTGTISGSGKDQRSNSATRGLIVYAVKPGDQPNETCVDVTIGYTLTGMLAQFGRSGLVQDVASRIIAAFARNLESKLSGGEKEVRSVAGEFDAGLLLFTVLFSGIKRFFAKLFKRSVG